MFSHVQSVFGTKPRRPAVANCTAQCKPVSHATASGIQAGIEVARINGSVKDPIFVEFIGYTEEVFNDAGYTIVVGSAALGNQFMIAADINTQAVGFSTLKRAWITSKVKVFITGIPTGGHTTGKFRLFITAKGSDSRGN